MQKLLEANDRDIERSVAILLDIEREEGDASYPADVPMNPNPFTKVLQCLKDSIAAKR